MYSPHARHVWSQVNQGGLLFIIYLSIYLLIYLLLLLCIHHMQALLDHKSNSVVYYDWLRPQL